MKLKGKFNRHAELCGITPSFADHIVADIKTVIDDTPPSDDMAETLVANVAKHLVDGGYRPEELVFGGYVMNILIGLVMLQTVSESLFGLD